MDFGNKLEIDCSDCRWHSDPPWVRERGKEVAVKNWSSQDVQFHNIRSSGSPYPELIIWECAHFISNWICKNFKVIDLVYDYVEMTKGCVWVLCMWLEISHQIDFLVAFFWSTGFFTEVYAECPACTVVPDIINSATHLSGSLCLLNWCSQQQWLK